MSTLNLMQFLAKVVKNTQQFMDAYFLQKNLASRCPSVTINIANPDLNAKNLKSIFKDMS